MRIDLALSTMLVFTITGMAVVEMSSLGRQEAIRLEQDHQNQVIVESALSAALWRINSVDDTTTTFLANGVACNFDTAGNQLSMGISRWGQTSILTAQVETDNHFKHAISVTDSFELNDYTLTAESSTGTRSDFRFLPQPDMDYYLNNAVQVHTESDLWIEDKEIGGLLNEPGIHVFLGDRIVLDAVTALDVTLVFTGENTTFYKNCTIKAPEAEVGVNPLPALVFTNENAVVRFKKEWGKADIVTGAIFSAGRIIMKHGEFSGPIISKDFILRRDVDLQDEDHQDLYRWHQGFGSHNAYQWPIHVETAVIAKS